MFRRDISDMCGRIPVDLGRVKNNAVGCEFNERKLRHLKSWTPAFRGKKLLGPPTSLAQGDGMAVEGATGSHVGALQEKAGVLSDLTRIGRTKPVPRGPFADLLVIDDYLLECFFNCLKDPHASGPGPSVARGILKRVDDAHDEVLLVRAPEKAGDSLTQDIRLGIECLGYLSHEGVPRVRRQNLIVIIRVISKLGVAMGKLLQVLYSLLINSFLLRRPLMSFLEGIFDYASDDALRVFRLPCSLQNELALSALVLVMSFTDFVRVLTLKLPVLTLVKAAEVLFVTN